VKILSLIFGIIIIVIVILADTAHLGPVGVVYDFPFGDKVGHFLLFGLFSLLVNLSVLEYKTALAAETGGKPDYKRSAVITSSVIAALAGLEEFSQLWFPSRTSSLFDLLASYLGIAFFTLLALRFKNRSR
jgi:VanZ family protein